MAGRQLAQPLSTFAPYLYEPAIPRSAVDVRHVMLAVRRHRDEHQIVGTIRKARTEFRFSRDEARHAPIRRCLGDHKVTIKVSVVTGIRADHIQRRSSGKTSCSEA